MGDPIRLVNGITYLVNPDGSYFVPDDSDMILTREEEGKPGWYQDPNGWWKNPDPDRAWDPTPADASQSASEH